MTDYRVKPGSKVKLGKMDPDDTGAFDPKKDGKAKAQARTDALHETLSVLQERLYANGSHALLVVLQGMDTAGKDGTIKHVMSGVNPLGCRVSVFKAPSHKELSHDFLWRIHAEVPPKGYIGLFNRSHYEDVLITRVHGMVSDKVATQRFRHINDFERLLHENGTTIVKCFLHISKDEQRKRLEARIQDPEKRWKFNPNDIAERKLWDRYVTAYEDAISATSTDEAPWYIVPSNYKWSRNVIVAETILAALEAMKLRLPPGPPGVDFKKLKID
ncbi:MAG TPA: polyphosphate kinase 2 family protein [Nitrospiraceae bacterium]|jgi:PPK2 family polyphosphate:nucleotide phosphotransferase|nr:polyphosphate kinase 2 family protein [Nitrospiraceae bacterium]